MSKNCTSFPRHGAQRDATRLGKEGAILPGYLTLAVYVLLVGFLEMLLSSDVRELALTFYYLKSLA